MIASPATSDYKSNLFSFGKNMGWPKGGVIHHSRFLHKRLQLRLVQLAMQQGKFPHWNCLFVVVLVFRPVDLLGYVTDLG